MRQLPTLPATLRDEFLALMMSYEPSQRRRRRNIKSGMDRTGATTVLKKITWPHEGQVHAAVMGVAPQGPGGHCL